jgi:chromosome segregation ATPase
MCIRPETTEKEASDAATTSMAKLVAVTSKNQNLKNSLMASQTQCESLEHEMRFQTAKAAELQDLLWMKNNGDLDALTSRILKESLALAERSLENDELKMKLQEVKSERHMMDQEREASVEMMAELTKVIRQQQIELQKRDAPESPNEFDPIECELGKLSKIHNHLMDTDLGRGQLKSTLERQRARDAMLPQNADLLSELEKLRSERGSLAEKNNAQEKVIATLKKKSQEREAQNIALVKNVKHQYNEDRSRLHGIQSSLEGEIELLKKEKEHSDFLYGEMIQASPKDDLRVGKSFIMQNGVFKVYHSDDNSSITEATVYTSSESDLCGPTTMEFTTERIAI